MPAVQLAIVITRLRWHPPRRLMASLVGTLSGVASQLRRWRIRRRQRSELFHAPSDTKQELQARGFDVELEINKPFWRP